jgi:nicotinamidase/pyrazinamidase
MVAISPTDALLVIDMQNDFCPGGALAVERGDEIVPLINQLGQRFEHVILTQDWHPTGHISFASTHPGKRPFETTEVAYGTQTLWPDHCVQGTSGADFHPGLHIPHAELILRKGFRREIDSYSAFLEDDHTTPTGLASYLRERGLKRLFLCGLAYDFCVRYSAIDGTVAGFECVVIENATRSVNLDHSVQETKAAFAPQSIAEIHSKTLEYEDIMQRCPCCGFKTLADRGAFEICPVCRWEDDGQDDSDADTIRGGPNGRLSLTEARRNFSLYAASDPQYKSNVRRPLSEEI